MKKKYLRPISVKRFRSYCHSKWKCGTEKEKILAKKYQIEEEAALYEEIAKRDFERQIYEECDKEDFSASLAQENQEETP